MRSNYLRALGLAFLILLFPTVILAQTCTNWLRLPSYPSNVTVGDLDVPGQSITVEALINRTAPWSGPDIWQGDIVAKHIGPTDCNYLLRPGQAEITTDVGYFRTPTVCNIQLNRTYHVAMTYDGATLKFYRNGYLMSQVAATGNLYQNNYQTAIGLYASTVLNEQFLGYINEVRIWNVVRTQQQIQSNMNGSLASPTTIPGLLAYYTFDNLLNKQGNPAWNATASANAVINQTNPNCQLSSDSCNVALNNVFPAFTAPDTVCLGTPVNITNTSINATNYYWNFCSADVNQPPTATNLGNPGTTLSQPVFMDIASDNGNYYAFVVNHNPGGLTRYDFGNSLLNTPTATFLGNPGGVLNSGYGSEGIQVVKNNGKWYAVIVGGTPTSSGTPRLSMLRFGTNITNNTPSTTNYGNIGNMQQAMDLHMFQFNGVWYGFTVNAETSTITRFNFTNDLDNAPTGTNLGNIGALNYPTGVCAVNDNGVWRTFVNNAGNGTLTRLDFGTSLLNTPTGTNLGNPSGLLTQPRDITILKYCGQSVGFVTDQTNKLIQLKFTSLTAAPAAVNLGNQGNMSYPHSLSKLFREGNDLYTMITNVSNNTISRLKFSGCTSTSLPSSNLQNPPAITYSQPGTYNINLTVDDGLPTQGTFCKKVVVLPPLAHTPLQTFSICQGDSLKIGTISNINNIWNGSVVRDSIWVNTTGVSYVDQSTAYCTNRDSVSLTVKPLPTVNLGPDTAFCKNGVINLNAGNAGASFVWNDNSTQQQFVVNDTGFYNVTVALAGCISKDTVHVGLFPQPVFQSINDTSVCGQTALMLQSLGSAGDSYNWLPSTGLNNSNVLSPTAQITGPVQFIGAATNIHGCVTKDTVNVGMLAMPVASLGNDTALCAGQVLTIGTLNNGLNYTWNTGSSAQTIQTGVAGVYSVAVNNSICTSRDTITVTVKPLPLVNLGADTSICKASTFVLNAGNPGSTYQWLDNSSAQTFMVPDTGFYAVKVTTNGCSGSDSIHVSFRPVPTVTTLADTALCAGSSIVLQSQGQPGYTYGWLPSASLSSPSQLSPIASPTASTQYILGATDAAGCKGYDTVQVNVTPLPVFNLGQDQIVCTGTAITLAPSAAGAVTWQNGSTSATFNVLDSGLYHAMVLFAGCKYSDTVHIAYYPSPAISTIPDSAVCNNNSIVLATTSTGVSSYQWTPSAGLSSPTSASPTFTVTGVHQFIVRGTSTDGCVVRDTVNLTSLPTPTVNLGQDQFICVGQSISLDAGAGNSGYQWSTGGSAQMENITQPGLYWINVAKGPCLARDTIEIKPAVATNFALSPQAPSLCLFDSVKLTASGAHVYQWYNSNGNLPITDSTLFAHAADASVFNVIMTDTVCHLIDTLSSVLSVIPAPTLNLVQENEVNCLTPTTRIMATGAANYQWLPGVGLSSLSSDRPLAAPSKNTTYYVTAKDINGCTREDSIEVLVNFAGKSQFFVPDAFTPNGDGKNDCFGVKFWAPAESFELSVFNRWGERVFYTTRQSECWDGKIRGVLHRTTEVFVYYIRVTSQCGTSFKKGTITLIQ